MALQDSLAAAAANPSTLSNAPVEYGESTPPILRLAPAYDLLPTHSGQGYQEFNCGKQGCDSTPDNAMSECDAFGLTPAEAAAEVAGVMEVVNAWKLNFAQMGVSPRDIENLAQQIDGDFLFKQRTGFKPERFISLPIKRPSKDLFSAVQCFTAPKLSGIN